MKDRNCKTCGREINGECGKVICNQGFTAWIPRTENISFPILNNLTPTEQSCTFKLLEEVGEVMQIIGKKSGASGEQISAFDAGDLIMEYMDVAQSAVTAIFMLCEKYGYDLRIVTETHEKKLKQKGYFK